jgi:hypothetical protein
VQCSADADAADVGDPQNSLLLACVRAAAAAAGLFVVFTSCIFIFKDANLQVRCSALLLLLLALLPADALAPCWLLGSV